MRRGTDEGRGGGLYSAIRNDAERVGAPRRLDGRGSREIDVSSTRRRNFE